MQDRIEILISNTEDEEAHQFCENFETTYFDLVGEIRNHLRRAQSISFQILEHVNIDTGDKDFPSVTSDSLV